MMGRFEPIVANIPSLIKPNIRHSNMSGLCQVLALE